jgi:hypothetical protein
MAKDTVILAKFLMSSRRDLPAYISDLNKPEDFCRMTEEKIPFVCPEDSLVLLPKTFRWKDYRSNPGLCQAL